MKELDHKPGKWGVDDIIQCERCHARMHIDFEYEPLYEAIKLPYWGVALYFFCYKGPHQVVVSNALKRDGPDPLPPIEGERT